MQTILFLNSTHVDDELMQVTQDAVELQKMTQSGEIESSGSWRARLDLDFNLAIGLPAGTSRDQHVHKTRLGFEHFGPLRIQKALYPEGPSPCHAIIVHPPGGIAGGDRLEVIVKSRAHSHGLVTNPSATKWYGTDSVVPASQLIDIELDGKFEWLPQETIVFNQARVRSDIHVRASAHGAMIGWDHLIFGRHASGETFATGHFNQTLRIEIDGAEVWRDKLVLQGNDPLFASPIGFRGHHALATVWAVLPQSQSWDEQTIQSLREQTATHGEQGIAWTVLHPRLLVGRVLANPLNLKSLLHDAWKFLRPHVLDRIAVAPRLWAT
jgi:urease accessory protein